MPVTRHWASDTYSLFFQDTWHAARNLSVTYGLNYQLMMPITETAGQEVTPSVNMGKWFNTRAADMLKGHPLEPGRIDLVRTCRFALWENRFV